MASIGKNPNGTKRILFYAPSLDRGKRVRKTIHLGEVSDQAAAIKKRIEQLIAAMKSNTAYRSDTQRWLDNEVTGTPLYDKLAGVGLVPKLKSQIEAEQRAAEERAAEDARRIELEAKTAEEQAATEEAARLESLPRLESFIDEYIDTKKPDKSDRTTLVWEHTKANLVDYFGANRLLESITEADAENWREWLKRPKNKDNPREGGGLGRSTIAKRCSVARQFFRYAKRQRRISENPFDGMKGMSVKANRKRYAFVERDVANLVLAACPDSQWKLIFALSRYGGLRCPSEHLELTWDDVNLERNRITVRSPKTAHHEGHEERIVPLFPELRPYLEAARDEVLASDDFDPKVTPLSKLPVISRYRNSNSNLRTQLLRILKRAGVKPWPKLFQNLRATRQNELVKQGFREFVVCQWLGNTEKVADEHYFQVDEDDYAAAAGTAPFSAPQGVALDCKSAFEPFLDDGENQKCTVIPRSAIQCEEKGYARQDSNLRPAD